MIVGIGGTARLGSSTECALRIALTAAARAGAQTTLFGGEQLASIPHYLTPGSQTNATGRALVDAVRRADGIIIASPGYHGSVSGIVKNAIDFLEETASDARPYLDGMPVGLVVTAYGWQATGSTLAALRSIVHALRGWPTPLGVTINSSLCRFTGDACSDDSVTGQLDTLGRQVHAFAAAQRGQLVPR